MFSFIFLDFCSLMGSVLSRCIYRQRKYIILVGLSGSGKSTLLRAMKGALRDGPGEKQVERTHVFEESTIRHRGYTLSIFDVEGKMQLSQFWKYYTWNSDLILFAIDISDTNAITSSKTPFEQFVNANISNGDKIIFLLNKVDLLGDDPDRVEEAVGVFKKVFGSIENFALDADRVFTCSAYADRKKLLKVVRNGLRRAPSR